MEPWGNPVSVKNVAAANGNLTQLYPTWLPAGSGSTTTGTWRRQGSEGTLGMCQIFPKSAQGGIFELWDVAGECEGAQNNTDTGATISDAYLQDKIAKNKARLIWRIGFKGDDGLNTKAWWTKTPIKYGLAARYINSDLANDAAEIDLSIAASGCFRRIQFAGT